jgi:hypothetical protein
MPGYFRTATATNLAGQVKPGVDVPRAAQIQSRRGLAAPGSCCRVTLERVADRELELVRVFVRASRVDREAPLEAQRAERRKPANPKADRGA